MGKCKCAFCGNENFVIPNEIIEAAKRGHLVIFAGAGISTEGKNVYKKTLYSEINDELGGDSQKSFPELMTQYCNQPNGKRKLISKIRDRFDYYKAFAEIDNVMDQFFKPLSDIYSIKEIITTNWDRQFEEKCGCIPIVYDKDVPLIDESKRNVYKIHGSIDNIGTLIITQNDYNKCYRRLRKSLLGNRINYLLSNKTVIFMGYSLEDNDFKKIWDFINKSLGDLRPHFFIVSPDEKLNDRLQDKNVTMINTLGSIFMKKMKEQLINENFILDSDLLYSIVNINLEIALDIHSKTNEIYHREKNSLIIYSLAYQDGIIHSLKRIISREKYGEYLNPIFLQDSIISYDSLYKEYVSSGSMFDAAYICGYTHAMDFIYYMYNYFQESNKSKFKDKMCLFYLPKNKIYDSITVFNRDLKEYRTKKYINYANHILKEFGDEDFEFEIHHLPFL